MLAMVMALLIRSDLFYQNPVLAALGYKTFEFRFNVSNEDVESDRTYILG